MKSQMDAQSEAADSMQQVLLINLVISYLSNSAMSQIWSAMNAMQVIAHMIFLPIKFPSATLDVF